MVKKWIPFKDLLFLQERMSRVFDEAISRYSGLEGSLCPSWSPPSDIYETEKAVTLKVEIPGVALSDVVVEIKEGVLTLSGERRMEKNLDEEHFHRMESFYGTFKRVFNLPDVVSDKGVKAKLTDGVLEVTVPKASKGRKKQKKVEVR